VPLHDDDALVGVFDLDSPEPDRFDADDQAGLEAIAECFMQACARRPRAEESMA